MHFLIFKLELFEINKKLRLQCLLEIPQVKP